MRPINTLTDVQQQAVCANHKDKDLWFSSVPSEREEAKRLCHTCPLALACRQLGKQQTHGVWGGLDGSVERGPHRDLPERNARIIELRSQGATFEAIASEVGMTRAGTRSAYNRLTASAA